MTFTLGELQTMAESVDLTISDTDIENIEMMTRGQSSCKEWFQYRAGRITASKLKAVCSTNIDKPSVSLLKAICYAQDKTFKTAATEWGIANEKVALGKYRQSVSDHDDVVVEQCGLFISTDYPFMGASPDSLVSCQCCGKGIVEVKCPYNYRWDEVVKYVLSNDSCFSVDDEIEMNKKHSYYYQVQAQMYICDVSFCNFVVCTFPSDIPSLFVKRIYRDSDFWNDCVQRACLFFRRCVLPELLGKAYTRPVSI